MLLHNKSDYAMYFDFFGNLRSTFLNKFDNLIFRFDDKKEMPMAATAAFSGCSHVLCIFFSFRPFPSIRTSHSVLSSSKPSCLQHPSPSHQPPPYPPSPHPKIFSLVSLFSSFPATPSSFLSIIFLPTYSWSLLMTCRSIPPQPALPHLHS